MSLLFTYGTLQRQQRNHWRLFNSLYLGQATIEGTLWQFSGCDFPILRRGHWQPKRVVHGELYRVTRAVLDIQDEREYWYKRVKVLARPVSCGPHGALQAKPLSCWVYEGLKFLPLHLARELKAGRWPS